jgi:transketolase
LDDLRAAIKSAKEETSKPSIIKIKTAIGYGSPSKQGSHDAHGAPLGDEDLAGAKKFYGLPADKSFHVPKDVQKVFTDAAGHGEKARVAWEAAFATYTAAHPEKAAELSRRLAHQLPDGIFDNLPSFTVGKDKDLATRKFSQSCLDALCPSLPEMVGGSADLTPSNCTLFDGAVDFQKDTPEGRYLRFGVREHGMVAISNGIFAYGGLRPFCATFLNFVGYCIGAVRLSALSRFGIMYIMTHDSIGLGEDGPTHQPVEMIESLRSMPNIMVWRPADSNETAATYKVGLTRTETPTVLCASRSTVMGLQNSSIEKACKGGYILLEEVSPALVLVATGSEVGVCVKSAAKLTAEGIPTRVVSMPCQEVFLEQSIEYQKSVLPGNIPTLSVEAASPHGWHRFSHGQIGMTTFGLSGKGDAVFEHFGFCEKNVVSKGKELIEFYKGAGSVPDLMSRPMFNNVMNGLGH